MIAIGPSGGPGADSIGAVYPARLAPVLWVFDLDGVVWLSGHAIPGSPESVHRLRDSGARVAFVTNNSTPTVAEYVERLAKAGIDIEPAELATSSQAAAALLEPGARVAVVGGEGVREAIEERRARIVAVADDPEAVVVGRSLRLDFDELAAAATAIRNGSRFIATNTDATFPTPHGPEPGAGALVAYLEVGSGRQPEVAGKPDQPMADLVKARFGQPDLVVGDRPETDGAFAVRIGAPYALVLTGVTRREDLPVTPPPALVGDDLADVVAKRMSGSSSDQTKLRWGMARDDRLKNLQEAGADFLETARARAEDFLRELSRAGGGSSGSLNDLLKESREGAEQLVGTIRKEIRSQLSSLGFATKTDLADLERKVSTKKASTSTTKKSPARKTTAAKKTASKSTATKSTASKSTTTARKSTPKKTAAKKTAAKKTAG